MSLSSSPRPGPPPVRLTAPDEPSAFAPGRSTVVARVEGDGLRAFDIRHGDRVVLARREEAEHGDIAAVLEAGGESHLWKVYPEGDELRLSMGYPSLERRSAPGAKVQGVVVAVLRRWAMRDTSESPEDDAGP